MTKIIFIVAGCAIPTLFGSSILYAQENDTPAIKRNFSVSLTSGFFHENFNWSIAGDIQGGTPNILSELIWKNLNGPSAAIMATWRPWKRLSFKTNIVSSFIASGKVSDTDYLNDNRTNATFHEIFDSDKGAFFSVEALVGYTLITAKNINVTSYLGYGAARESFFLIGESLKSSYETTCKGPIVQAELQVKITSHISAEPLVSYHQLQYRATANWNLVERFKHPVSFEHSAKGYQVSIGNKIRYHFNSGLSIAVAADYASGRTGKGIDKLYLSNDTIAYTQFNNAARKRFFAGIEAAISF